MASNIGWAGSPLGVIGNLNKIYSIPLCMSIVIVQYCSTARDLESSTREFVLSHVLLHGTVAGCSGTSDTYLLPISVVELTFQMILAVAHFLIRAAPYAEQQFLDFHYSFILNRRGNSYCVNKRKWICIRQLLLFCSGDLFLWTSNTFCCSLSSDIRLLTILMWVTACTEGTVMGNLAVWQALPVSECRKPESWIVISWQVTMNLKESPSITICYLHTSGLRPETPLICG